jgi:hypothetical protein
MTFILYYFGFALIVNSYAYVACRRAKTDVELWGEEIE